MVRVHTRESVASRKLLGRNIMSIKAHFQVTTNSFVRLDVHIFSVESTKRIQTRINTYLWHDQYVFRAQFSMYLGQDQHMSHGVIGTIDGYFGHN
jgi:hypothetical protein